MDNGFILLHRKSLDSLVFQDEGLWKVWCWCLMKASYKERWISMKSGKGSVQVKLLPGQFVFGRDSASKELRMKPSTIWDRMIKLKKAQNTDIESNSQYSIITIVNWQTYQTNILESDSESNYQPTANRQPTDTNNNSNKVIREIKTTGRRSNGFHPPTLEEVSAYCKERKNNIDPEAFIAHYESNGWKVGQNKMQNWKGSVITWEKKRQERLFSTVNVFDPNEGLYK